MELLRNSCGRNFLFSFLITTIRNNGFCFENSVWKNIANVCRWISMSIGNLGRDRIENNNNNVMMIIYGFKLTTILPALLSFFCWL